MIIKTEPEHQALDKITRITPIRRGLILCVPA
jgi:hypothetical protein